MEVISVGESLGCYKRSGEDLKCKSLLLWKSIQFSIIMIIKLENKFHFGIISQEMVIDRSPGRVNTKNAHEDFSIHLRMSTHGP